MVNILPFLGPPRQPEPRRTNNAKPTEEQPGFLTRLTQPRGEAPGPRRAAGRGILIPGQQLPHITLNTVQVRCTLSALMPSRAGQNQAVSSTVWSLVRSHKGKNSVV